MYMHPKKVERAKEVIANMKKRETGIVEIKNIILYEFLHLCNTSDIVQRIVKDNKAKGTVIIAFFNPNVEIQKKLIGFEKIVFEKNGKRYTFKSLAEVARWQKCSVSTAYKAYQGVYEWRGYIATFYKKDGTQKILIPEERHIATFECLKTGKIERLKTKGECAEKLKVSPSWFSLRHRRGLIGGGRVWMGYKIWLKGEDQTKEMEGADITETKRKRYTVKIKNVATGEEKKFPTMKECSSYLKVPCISFRKRFHGGKIGKGETWKDHNIWIKEVQ